MQELCTHCVNGEKQEVAVAPHSPEGSFLPRGKEVGRPWLLLLTLAGQQADSCAVWNRQVLKAGVKILRPIPERDRESFQSVIFIWEHKRFLTVIAVANNRKKLLSTVLLPYSCLHCCISRLNHKDTPDREVAVGFRTTLRDWESLKSEN